MSAPTAAGEEIMHELMEHLARRPSSYAPNTIDPQVRALGTVLLKAESKWWHELWDSRDDPNNPMPTDSPHDRMALAALRSVNATSDLVRRLVNPPRP